MALCSYVLKKHPINPSDMSYSYRKISKALILTQMLLRVQQHLSGVRLLKQTKKHGNRGNLSQMESGPFFHSCVFLSLSPDADRGGSFPGPFFGF